MVVAVHISSRTRLLCMHRRVLGVYSCFYHLFMRLLLRLRELTRFALDADKRAAFDRHGSDPESRFSGMSSRASSASFSNGSAFGGGGFEGEVSPEDLFNMFFGGGMGGGNAFGGAPGAYLELLHGGLWPDLVLVFSASFGPGGFRTTRVYTNTFPRQRTAPQQQQEPLTAKQILINLLPIIILFGFSILSALPSLFSTALPPDPHFSFSPSARFNLQRQTTGLGIPYHVNSAEFKSHPIAAELARNGGTHPHLKRFEEHVDRAYTQDMYNQCQRGLSSKQRRRDAQIGLFGINVDWEAVKKIEEEEVGACEILRSKGLLK